MYYYITNSIYCNFLLKLFSFNSTSEKTNIFQLYLFLNYIFLSFNFTIL